MACHYIQCVTCHILFLLQNQSTIKLLGSLSKPQSGWQHKFHKIKSTLSRTVVLYVHSTSLCTSLPSSAEKVHELTKFCVVCGTQAAPAFVSYLSYRIEHCHYILPEQVFRAIGILSRSRQLENFCHPWQLCCCCLSSLI